MGNRSDRRIFRRRRRRAGLVLLASLAIILLGGFLFSSLTETDALASNSSEVDRVQQPVAASAPEAVEAVAEEQPDQAMSAGEAAAKDEAARKETNRQEAAGAQEKEPDAPPPPQDKTMYLTVPKIGLYDNVVYNSSDPAALDAGAAKLEESGFPWEDSANPYISGHRLGWPGTASYYQFYNLPLMANGDVIYLTDANGTTYTYEVTETIEVAPNEVWVSNPVAGRDMISLQTCTETFGDYWTMGPNWSTRYVVRGDRVDVSHA
ncbi:MAG: sortase [Rubrobacteraceae bacterium]